MNICFLDNIKTPYSSLDIKDSKIRGAENILINLSSELSKLGHNVTVINNIDKDIIVKNIRWLNINNKNLDKTLYDLAFTNNDIGLFDKIKAIKYVAFSHSIQSIEKFIRKRQLIPYLKYKPKIVLLSNYHDKNRNFLLKMFGSLRLDWSVDQIFIDTKLNDTEKEDIAIFTSRADRNLNMIIDMWKKYIYTSNNKLKLLITPNNTSLQKFNIFERNLGKKDNLIKDLLSSKIFLAPGHKAELYCIAAEEAKELCLPIITLGIGALSERVEHGVTGFIAKDIKEFSYYITTLFNNKELLNKIRKNLEDRRGKSNWNNVAVKLINLI